MVIASTPNVTASATAANVVLPDETTSAATFNGHTDRHDTAAAVDTIR